jgi:hypothetical protein
MKIFDKIKEFANKHVTFIVIAPMVLAIIFLIVWALLNPEAVSELANRFQKVGL